MWVWGRARDCHNVARRVTRKDYAQLNLKKKLGALERSGEIYSPEHRHLVRRARGEEETN